MGVERAFTAVSTAVGVLLIAVVLRDVVQTIFVPAGRGALGEAAARAAWNGFRRLGRARGAQRVMAGPMVVIGIVVLWAGLLILGWAFVYWPHVDEAFLLDEGFRRTSDFVDALYLSTVIASTVGFGDVTPNEAWLRVVAPVEALLGFALLTAVISWILSIHAVLSRRFVFARRLFVAAEAVAAGSGLAAMDDDRLERRLAELTAGTVDVRNDLLQFPETYYFAPGPRRTPLPEALPFLLEIAAEGRRPSRARAVHEEAAELERALEDLAAALADQFLGLGEDASVDEVLAAYAADQGGAGAR